jgi:hypothetical protein
MVKITVQDYATAVICRSYMFPYLYILLEMHARNLSLESCELQDPMIFI